MSNNNNTRNTNGTSPTTAPSPSNDPPTELATIVLSLLGTFFAARLLAVVSRMATALAAPLAGLYLMSTCPSNESFDAKRELKRVFRGDNLPEDHPDKPKGFLGKAIAKVSATIEAEAAALSGCAVEIIDIIGIVKIAIIRNSVTNKDYYWLGAVNRWRFVMIKSLPGEARPKRE